MNGTSSSNTRLKVVTLDSAEKVNVAEKLSLFDEHWSPKTVGELNGQHVKLVKLLGEFVCHHHDDEDEMFLVVDGRFRTEFRDREVWLEPQSLSWCRAGSSTGPLPRMRPA
jgi:mannose-6-phosphate isomerase-like protein (cupin superfamily)